MKRSIETFQYKLIFLFFLLMNTTIAVAQDGGGTNSNGDQGSVTVSKSTTTTSSTVTQEWYTQPWVWIVGGLVFILLLVALIRGGGSRTDVHRTTIRKDVTTSD